MIVIGFFGGVGISSMIVIDFWEVRSCIMIIKSIFLIWFASPTAQTVQLKGHGAFYCAVESIIVIQSAHPLQMRL